MSSIEINSQEAIQKRFLNGNIPGFAPILMLFARSILILLAQGVTFILFLQLKIPNTSIVIRNWWTVYGTLADLGCLGLLYWLTRLEGIQLRDLIGLVKTKIIKEVSLGLGLFAIIAPITIFGGGMLAQLIVYGQLNPDFPEYTFIKTLPLLAVLYSRIIWWPIWSVTEEMTYNGYALPRLIALTKSRWLSVLIVSFFFALQHSFLMLADIRFAIYTFLAFLPLSIAMVTAYLRIRRLPPMIVAHWLMDLSNVLFLLQTR